MNFRFSRIHTDSKVYVQDQVYTQTHLNLLRSGTEGLTMSLILIKPSIGLTSTEDNGKLRDLRRKHGDIHKLESLCRFENYRITVLKYKLFDVCASVWKETQNVFICQIV